MNRRELLRQVSCAALVPVLAPAQQAAPDRDRFVAKAEALKPRLRRIPKRPVRLVTAAPDTSQFFQWRMGEVGPAAGLRDRLMGKRDSIILDFGEHLTGHLSFSLAGEGRGIDAPARIKLIFGEVPAEVAEPFESYRGGLSRAWLQDEVVNIDVLPTTVELPRRYAFRYLKLEVVDTSPNFRVRFNDVHATALTSAGEDPQPLPGQADALVRRIDAVSLNTLRECMQTVFEDGPKRDRRLWIGDLRLQALTNYVTFRNYDLVKRCLYLFAGLPREDGFVAACVFEDPKPLRGHEYIVDYAALYPAVLNDYVRASGDSETARELWPVAARQIEILTGYVGADGLFAAPRNSWVFVDWNSQLDRTAAMHGIFAYALQQAAALSPNPDQRSTYAGLALKMKAAARSAFFDSSRNVFTSGPKRQVSWATQAWMVLSGIANPEEGAATFRALPEMTGAVRPGGPYLYHYVVEAMLLCGMKKESSELLRSYWGGMVEAGADTFWEVYDPKNPKLSPYGDYLVNSYCHAWSCTPSYFLRSGAFAG